MSRLSKDAEEMDRIPGLMYSAGCLKPDLVLHRLIAIPILVLYVANMRESAYAAAKGPQTVAPAASSTANASQASYRRNVPLVSSAESQTQTVAFEGAQREKKGAELAVVYSGVRQKTDQVVCEGRKNNAAQLRAPPRRLAMSRAFLSILAQYFFHSDMRRLLKRSGYRMAEVVKGIPTGDYDLNYYQQRERCLTTFDIISEWGALGPVEVDSIEVKFLPAQHRGVLTYVEKRNSNVEFLKPIQRHMQNFLLPHGCVATSNSTWTGYCTTVEPPCVVGRIDISTSAIPADELLVPLQPVDNEIFSGQLLKDGWDWYEVQDLYEAVPDYPKPLHMAWAYDRCILHAYFETKAIEKTQYFWMRSRQAFQVLMEQVNGTLYRKMSAFPPTCGGREEKDFVVTVKALEPPGNYKAIMSAQIYSESITSAPDEIVLKMQKPLLPLEDWDPEEEEIDFIELFPDTQAVPLYELESGPFD